MNEIVIFLFFFWLTLQIGYMCSLLLDLGLLSILKYPRLIIETEYLKLCLLF